MMYGNSYLKRTFIFTLIFTFVCVHTFPLPASEYIKTDFSQLNHPAAQLIEKKLKKLSKLPWDEDNSKVIDKAVEILVDLKFDLWNQFEMYICAADAVDQLKEGLKEQGIKDAKNYVNPIHKKLKKAIKRRYKEEAEKKSSFVFATQYEELVKFDRDLQDDEEDVFLNIQHETGKDQKKDDKKTGIKCPPSFEFWVTASLVGFFVSVLPIPGAPAVGVSIFSTSIVNCANIVLAIKDEEFKKQQEEESGSDCSYCDDRHCPYHDDRRKEREREHEKNRGRNGY